MDSNEGVGEGTRRAVKKPHCKALIWLGAVGVLAILAVVLIVVSRPREPQFAFLDGATVKLTEGQYNLSALLSGRGVLGGNLRFRRYQYMIKGNFMSVQKQIHEEVLSRGYSEEDALAGSLMSWRSAEEVGGKLWQLPKCKISPNRLGVLINRVGSGRDDTFAIPKPGHVGVEILEVYEPTMLDNVVSWMQRLTH